MVIIRTQLDDIRGIINLTLDLHFICNLLHRVRYLWTVLYRQLTSWYKSSILLFLPFIFKWLNDWKYSLTTWDDTFMKSVFFWPSAFRVRHAFDVENRRSCFYLFIYLFVFVQKPGGPFSAQHWSPMEPRWPKAYIKSTKLQQQNTLKHV